MRPTEGSGQAAGDPDRLADERTRLAALRTELANERTLLAYLRTALALFVTGVGFLHLLEQTWARLTGWSLLFLAFPAAAVGAARFVRLRRRLRGRGGRDAPAA